MVVEPELKCRTAAVDTEAEDRHPGPACPRVPMMTAVTIAEIADTTLVIALAVDAAGDLNSNFNRSKCTSGSFYS